MNRITQKLQETKKIFSIYFSAGYPNLNDTVQIIQDLEKNGVDMIEIGLVAMKAALDMDLSEHKVKIIEE